jgi:hypothetical protein
MMKIMMMRGAPELPLQCLGPSDPFGHAVHGDLGQFQGISKACRVADSGVLRRAAFQVELGKLQGIPNI